MDNVDGDWFYFGDWIASLLAIVTLVLVLVAPIAAYRFINRNEENF